MIGHHRPSEAKDPKSWQCAERELAFALSFSVPQVHMWSLFYIVWYIIWTASDSAKVGFVHEVRDNKKGERRTVSVESAFHMQSMLNLDTVLGLDALKSHSERRIILMWAVETRFTLWLSAQRDLRRSSWQGKAYDSKASGAPEVTVGDGKRKVRNRPAMSSTKIYFPIFARVFI